MVIMRYISTSATSVNDYNMVCTFAFGTLFLYDYFLTLRDEVHYVWKRQFSIATYIFFLLRYLAALFMTLVGLDLLIVGETQRLHDIWALMEKVVMIGWYFAFISFMALRIHAIWDFNIIVTSLVLIPGAFVIVWTLYTYVGDPKLRHLDTQVLSYYFAFFGLDAIALLLTWIKTAGTAWTLYKVSGYRGWTMSLTALILRDGSLYFALLIVAKFVMVFGLRCNFTPLLGPDFPTMCLGSASMCRFMLHLRQAQTGQPISETPSRLEAGFITHGSSLHFTGDLGTPFAVAVHEELEDDES